MLDDLARLGEAVADFKRVVMRELIEPWAIPFANVLVRMLRRMGFD